MINLKDFNILGFKVSTNASKKDIGIVSGYNMYVQKIENICKTQQGELPSSPSLGSNYYNLIFDPLSNKSFTEIDLDSFIKYGIKDIQNVKTQIVYADDQRCRINVKFLLSNYLKNQNMECTIEVPLK